MTTSHRPQLEARSGAKTQNYTPTATQHARLLPGHTKLKTRKRQATHSHDKQDNRTDGQDAAQDAGQGDGHFTEQEDGRIARPGDTRLALVGSAHEISHFGDDLRIKEEVKVKQEVDDIRPSWTGGTAFSRKNRVSKKQKKKKFTNDTVQSEEHKQFLDKHVK
ncbi:Pre-mRNA-splicing factor CWC15 [Nakaseomyces bracarensis]|uniref:Pre-mRNA-splicing factor CWC15 n=1 Tax=Nakaseomyces bracarensis TaxID=273131 RepID=A0ABR4NT28_9SACH